MKKLMALSVAVLMLGLLPVAGATVNASELDQEIRADADEVRLEDAKVVKVSPDSLIVKILGAKFKVHLMTDTEIGGLDVDEDPVDFSGFMKGDIVEVRGTADMDHAHLIHAERVDLKEGIAEDLDDEEDDD